MARSCSCKHYLRVVSHTFASKLFLPTAGVHLRRYLGPLPFHSPSNVLSSGKRCPVRRRTCSDSSTHQETKNRLVHTLRHARTHLHTLCLRVPLRPCSPVSCSPSVTWHPAFDCQTSSHSINQLRCLQDKPCLLCISPTSVSLLHLFPCFSLSSASLVSTASIPLAFLHALFVSASVLISPLVFALPFLQKKKTHSRINEH